MNRFKEILKNNKTIYYIYNTFVSLLVKFMGLFIKVDDKIVLFNSFGGKKYDDSPRVIYEYMISQKKYDNYKFYWVLDNPQSVTIPKCEIIKNNSIKFFIVALKSKYWITNSGVERGLKFKKKKTILINTWHGTAIKHIGIDENNLKIRFNTSKPDVLFAQSKYDVDIFSHVFEVPKDNIVVSGLPRNDELVNINPKEKNNIMKLLKIPNNKKIILYAPTFREYSRDKNGCFLAPPIDLKKWERELSKNYILLFRAHYEVNKVLGIQENDFVKDVSNYQNLNQILKITDILISDYSSIMIDYSILERPIFNYIYDFDEYKEKRGMYFDLREKLPGNCIASEDELINAIKNIDYEQECGKTKKFKNEFVQEYGNARKYIDKIIYKEDKQ